MINDSELDSMLYSAFSKANAQLECTDSFQQKVMSRLAHKKHLRTVVLGGAGTTGSAISVDQLAKLVDQIHFTNPLLNHSFELLGADTIISFSFAVLAALIAWLVPKKSL